MIQCPHMAKEKENSKKMSTGKVVLIVLGVLLTLFILFIGLIIAVLLTVKPFGMNLSQTVPVLLGNPIESTYDHPYLDADQEATLRSIGIDPANIPTEITAAQQQCAIEAVGAERVEAIMHGSTPTLSEILSVEKCF